MTSLATRTALVLNAIEPVSSTKPAPRLRVVDPREIENWDELVRTHPDSTVFHSAAWTRVICETYCYKPFYLAAYDNERVEAVLPIIEVKTWFTPRRGIGLPFTDACQGLTSPRFDFRSLLENALALGKQNGWEYLEVRGASSNAKLHESVTFYNHKLDLKPGSDLLFTSFDSSVRRAIRKAEGSGIEVVRVEGANGIQDYYRLHCLTRQSHGVPPQPYSFFKAIHQHIIRRNLGTVFLAKQHGQTIAGAVFFHFGSKALYKFGASDPRYERFRPNNLWMWRAIQHYSEARCDELDFGRTSVGNEGLRRYKQNWATAETKSTYTRMKVSDGTFLVQKDNVNNWQTKLFRHCPIGIARIIGKFLYRHAA